MAAISVKRSIILLHRTNPQPGKAVLNMSSHPCPSQHGYNYHGTKNPNAMALEITKGLLNFAFVLVT